MLDRRLERDRDVFGQEGAGCELNLFAGHLVCRLQRGGCEGRGETDIGYDFANIEEEDYSQSHR